MLLFSWNALFKLSKWSGKIHQHDFREMEHSWGRKICVIYASKEISYSTHFSELLPAQHVPYYSCQCSEVFPTIWQLLPTLAKCGGIFFLLKYDLSLNVSKLNRYRFLTGYQEFMPRAHSLAKSMTDVHMALFNHACSVLRCRYSLSEICSPRLASVKTTAASSAFLTTKGIAKVSSAIFSETHSFSPNYLCQVLI